MIVSLSFFGKGKKRSYSQVVVPIVADDDGREVNVSAPHFPSSVGERSS